MRRPILILTTALLAGGFTATAVAGHDHHRKSHGHGHGHGHGPPVRACHLPGHHGHAWRPGRHPAYIAVAPHYHHGYPPHRHGHHGYRHDYHAGFYIGTDGVRLSYSRRY